MLSPENRDAIPPDALLIPEKAIDETETSQINEKSLVEERSAVENLHHAENDFDLPIDEFIPDVSLSLENYSDEPLPRTGKKSIQRLRRRRRKTGSTNVAGPIAETVQISRQDFRYGVLDIETQRSAQEVGGWHRADLMRVSCVVVFDSKTDQYLEFLESQVPDLIEMLHEFDLMVGFNIKRFDYRVLSGYTNHDFKTVPTLDILEDVHAHLGYRLSLDHLAGVTLGTQKSGDGLQALKWWKEGRIEEIIEYCKKDVQITKSLFEYGQDKGYLLFTNKAKQTVRIPVKWNDLQNVATGM